MKALGSCEGGERVRLGWGRWITNIGKCSEAFWEVSLKPSLWLSMRNGESVTGAKRSWQPTGLTSSDARTHAHTYTHTALLHQISSLTFSLFFFPLFHNFVFEKHKLKFLLSESHQRSPATFMCRSSSDPLLLKDLCLAAVGPRAEFGRKAGADRDKLHNAEQNVCQEANGSLKKHVPGTRVCSSVGCGESANGKYPKDAVVLYRVMTPLCGLRLY